MEQYTRDDALQEAINYVYHHDCDNVCVVAWKSYDEITYSTSSCTPSGMIKAAAHILCGFVTKTINTKPELIEKLIKDAFEKIIEEQLGETENEHSETEIEHGHQMPNEM